VQPLASIPFGTKQMISFTSEWLAMEKQPKTLLQR
jgi:hypothetical protein